MCRANIASRGKNGDKHHPRDSEKITTRFSFYVTKTEANSHLDRQIRELARAP